MREGVAMSRMRTVATATVMSAALVLTACGGGGARLSKDEYLKQADKICKGATTETDKIAAPASENALPQYIAEVAKVAKKMLKDLRALDGPKADEKKVSAIYDAYEKALDAIVADPNALMTAKDSPFTEAGKQAQSYGFKECGSQ